MRVLQNANEALQSSLDGMQTSIGGVWTSVDALGERMSHAEENIAQTQGDLEAVAELSTELDELKSTVGVYGSQTEGLLLWLICFFIVLFIFLFCIYRQSRAA